jgi:hypothetical protein
MKAPGFDALSQFPEARRHEQKRGGVEPHSLHTRVVEVAVQGEGQVAPEDVHAAGLAGHQVGLQAPLAAQCTAQLPAVQVAGDLPGVFQVVELRQALALHLCDT